MRILLTGASGFLGTSIMNTLGKHQVISLGRKQQYNNIRIDLSKEIPTLPENIHLVIHAAGKAHSLIKSNIDNMEYFKINLIGTRNLLAGLENAGLPKSFVFISSVAVYGKESGNLLGLDSPLLAIDAYGLSKLKAEEIVLNWCTKNNVIGTILRLPLIAGPNPPGNLKSMITGIQKGYYFNIDRGRARKSIVLAQDVAAIIPKAAEIGGIYNLTDGYHPTFAQLSELIAKQLNKNKPRSIPLFFAKILAKLGDVMGSQAPINSAKFRKITSDLTFDDSKARVLLKWNPTGVLDGFKIY